MRTTRFKMARRLQLGHRRLVLFFWEPSLVGVEGGLIPVRPLPPAVRLWYSIEKPPSFSKRIRTDQCSTIVMLASPHRLLCFDLLVHQPHASTLS